jgi:hypothetical protein
VGGILVRVVGSGTGVVRTGGSDSTEVGVATGSSTEVSVAVDGSSVAGSVAGSVASVTSVVFVTGSSVVSLLEGRGVTGVSVGRSEVVVDSSGGSDVPEGMSLLTSVLAGGTVSELLVGMGSGVGVTGGSEIEVLVGVSSMVVEVSSAPEEVSLTGGKSEVRSSIRPELDELLAELPDAVVEAAVLSSVPLVVVGSGKMSEMMGSRSISFVELELELERELDSDADFEAEAEAEGVLEGVPVLLSDSESEVLVGLGSRPGITMPVGPMMIPPSVVSSSSSSSSDEVDLDRADVVESPPSTSSRRSSRRPRRVEDWMVVVEAGSGSSSVVELPI